jgi:SAM-dependent methyltransferase
MNNSYIPKNYWEERLKNRFNLQGVGHIGFSKAYNHWLYQRKRRCLETALHDIKLADKDVLDIGCGTGFFVKWYLQKRARVWGVDITETSVQQLQQQFDGEFYTQDITAAGFSLSKKFDLVNMWDVIYHVVDPEAFARGFDNIAGSLKEGGLLLFTDWFGAPSDVKIADHVQARCLDTYQAFMSQKGFSLLKLYPLFTNLNRHHYQRWDNHLGWLYYVLDNHANTVASNNLSLGVWRFNS